MRCVLVTTRPRNEDLTRYLGNENLPNLEIIHASQEELGQWYSLDTNGLNLQLDLKSSSDTIAEAAPV